MEESKKGKSFLSTPHYMSDNLGGILIFFLIYYLGIHNGFDRTSFDTIIIFLVAIFEGWLYYKLKGKIKVKNEAIKIILAVLLLIVLAGLVIGFLTAIV
jgi:hypothetical protein